MKTVHQPYPIRALDRIFTAIMISRVITVVSLVILFVSSVSAQTYDPAAEQLAMQAFFDGSCSGGASDESSRCTWLGIADADGSHVVLLPQSGAIGAPSWSPDGRSLVSVRDNAIFITSATGAPETFLTSGAFVDQTPAWSPDGTRIAFASNRGGTTDLYLMNADGSGVTPIVTGMAIAWEPSWSPNGARLAFTCMDSSFTQCDICSINADGSGFVQLTNDPADDFDPAWSHDGSTILFSTRRFGGFIGDTASPRTELALMNAVDGSGVVPVSPGTYAFSPSWSMDGGRIAFESSDPYSDLGYGPTPTIGVMNADGTGAMQVAVGSTPSWRPMTGVGTNNRPLASFTSSCTNGVCTFNGAVSSDSDGTVNAFGWQFGDGATDSVATTTHTFVTGQRDYGVALIVMDNQGALAATSQTLDLNQAPVASFTYRCTGLTCTFDGSASHDPDGTVGYFTWLFGDSWGGYGTTPTHTYTAAGSYVVRLTVYDSGNKTNSQTQTITTGSAPPTASFTFTCNLFTCNFDGAASSDTGGTVTAWAWSFGDSTTGSGVATSHTYTASGNYDVTLTVTNNSGLSGSTTRSVPIVQPILHSGDLDALVEPAGSTWKATVTITVHDASENLVPSAQVTASWSTGAAGTCTTNAAGQCSIATSGIANSTASVTFTVSAISKPGCTYRQASNHDWDGDGSNGTTMTIINTAPAASFTFACSNRTCTFDGSGSSDADGTVVSYAWNFGDGTIGSAQTAAHTFAAAGSYTVTLTVTDNSAATGTQSKTVTIVNAVPAASFTITCSNTRTCAFDGSGSSDADGMLVNYAWNFGDGSTGTGQTASHTYTLSGNYTATLTVTDNDAATATQSKPVTIPNTAPAAAFTFTCSVLTCSFNGSGSSDIDGTIASYAWTFGDGMAGSGQTAAHTYSAPGNYNVTLTVTDNLGATNATTHAIAVTQPEVHVGDLDGATQNLPGTWNAIVTVRIHDNVHNSVANATVNGSWSSGQTGTCTTSANGSCSISLSSIPNKTGSVAFAVTIVTYANSTYRSASNHDPDGDSNGTSITLKRP